MPTSTSAAFAQTMAAAQAQAQVQQSQAQQAQIAVMQQAHQVHQVQQAQQAQQARAVQIMAAQEQLGTMGSGMTNGMPGMGISQGVDTAVAQVSGGARGCLEEREKWCKALGARKPGVVLLLPNLKSSSLCCFG